MLQRIGTLLTKICIALLPWSVIISVVATERLHFGALRFFKEGIIFLISLIWVWDIVRSKVRPTLDALDYSIIAYCFTLIIVSIFQGTPIRGIVFGLRYDTEFLLAFSLFRRVLPFWHISFRDIAKIFLISGGVMLVISILIRGVFGETLLTIFGFSGQVSVWDPAGPPPIYHGIAGAAVVRFQGMLEGPNQMAFFLAVYIGTYLSVFSHFLRYRFLNILTVALLLYLVIETYSRSAYIGFFLAGTFLTITSLWGLWRRGLGRIRWRNFIIPVICAALIFGGLSFQFRHKFAAIFERHGSTSGHFERSYIGYLRFLEAPLGSGLASSGPAARSIYTVNEDPADENQFDLHQSAVLVKLHEKNPDFIYTTETYFIPESWYIQQLIEGGIFGFVFFAIFFFLLFLRLRPYRYCISIGIVLCMMAAVLHIFESVHTTLACFILFAALVPVYPSKKYLSGK